MKTGLSDTIAAIATAPGHAGVGILRISGPEALKLADAVFRGKKEPSQTPAGRFLFGQLWLDEELLDEALCLIFRAPRSYTGEDVIELQTHGSPAVLSRLLSEVLARGARLARAGEFTLRAYLSGRLDLTQAEAVLHLVQAGTETARKQSALGLSGAVAKRVHEISADITRTLAAIQAMLDYPEEGVPDEERYTPLQKAITDLQQLIGTAKAGRTATQGAKLALIGKPNAGKSSLLNALLGYERSIVTPIAGTTRDYLEAQIELAGLPITLLDTAGLRDTSDEIEAAGVRQALHLAEHADLVLVLEDGSQKREALPYVLPADVPVLYLRTKSDLEPAWCPSAPSTQSEESTQQPAQPTYIDVSAKTGEGLAEIRTQIECALLGDLTRTEAWLTTERQTDAAKRALDCVQAALHLPDDLASYELEEALHALAELTGQDVQEEVIDAVFSNFCVGK